MAPPKQRIELSPSEVTLDLATSTSPSSTLTISNPSQSENLLYKVRTTNPKRYLVKPNQEVLMAGNSTVVTIQMQARECAEILEHGLLESEAKGKDKFMISCIVADEQTLRQIKTAREAGAKELQQAFTDIWAAHGKDDTANRRVGVDFILPKSSVPQTPSSAPSPAATNGNAASSVAKPVARTAEKAAAPAQTMSAQPQSTPASMSGVVASQIQTPNKKADEVIGTVTSNALASSHPSSEAEVSYDTLARQYKETLAALVQVTEERDRFQQKFKEVSRDMVQLKDDLRATSKGRSGGDSETLSLTKPGYQIWHLVLVAMVSFLVAKLMEISRNDFLSAK